MHLLQSQLLVNLLLSAFGLVVAVALLCASRKLLPPTSKVRLQLEKLGVFKGGDAVLAVLLVIGGIALTLYYS